MFLQRTVCENISLLNKKQITVYIDIEQLAIAQHNDSELSEFRSGSNSL